MSLEAEVLAEKLAAGVTVEIKATGVSMGTAVPPESVLTVASLPPRLGDVMVWQSETGLIAHRALWRRDSQWLMKGDGNTRCDGWVEQSEFLGRVVGSSKGSLARCVPWVCGVLQVIVRR